MMLLLSIVLTVLGGVLLCMLFACLTRPGA